jgi:hypothetical protein
MYYIQTNFHTDMLTILVLETTNVILNMSVPILSKERPVCHRFQHSECSGWLGYGLHLVIWNGMTQLFKITPFQGHFSFWKHEYLQDVGQN